MGSTRIIKIVLLFMVTCTVAFAALTIDLPAPLFSATGLDGAMVNLVDLRGQTVILEWTNAECPYVKKHYQRGSLPRLQKSAHLRNIVWLQVIAMVSGAKGEQIRITKLPVEYSASNIFLDTEGRLSRLYGAQTTPQIYIINSDGVLVYQGAVDNIASQYQADIPTAENYISAALADLAEGKKVAKSNTQPYGCPVIAQAWSSLLK